MKAAKRLVLRRMTWLPVVGTAAMLSACYVVPVNPTTGQPYPVQQPAPVATVPININTVLQAKLYPLNAQATKAGALIATAVDNRNGRGTFSLTYMGEPMQGDATRVDSSYTAFGRVYREVLGVGSETNRGGHRGIANAFGPNGTSMQCEYHMTAKDVGTGVCLFSNGAKYQMHFGS